MPVITVSFGAFEHRDHLPVEQIGERLARSGVRGRIGGDHPASVFPHHGRRGEPAGAMGVTGPRRRCRTPAGPQSGP